jgi:hypothetical protein
MGMKVFGFFAPGSGFQKRTASRGVGGAAARKQKKRFFL